MQKPSASVLKRLYDQWQEKWSWKWKIDYKDTAIIDLGLGMDTNILNIKNVSHYNDGYAY